MGSFQVYLYTKFLYTNFLQNTQPIGNLWAVLSELKALPVSHSCHSCAVCNIMLH